MEVDSQVHVPALPEVEQPRALTPEPQVVKTIRKTEVELLCNQHNPVRIRHFPSM